MKIEGGFFKAPFDDLYSDPLNPMKIGTIVEVKGSRIKILSLNEKSNPKRVAYLYKNPISEQLLRRIKNNHNQLGMKPNSISLKDETRLEFEPNERLMKNIYERFQLKGKPIKVGQSIELPAMSAKFSR